MEETCQEPRGNNNNEDDDDDDDEGRRRWPTTTSKTTMKFKSKLNDMEFTTANRNKVKLYKFG